MFSITNVDPRNMAPCNTDLTVQNTNEGVRVHAVSGYGSMYMEDEYPAYYMSEPLGTLLPGEYDSVPFVNGGDPRLSITIYPDDGALCVLPMLWMEGERYFAPLSDGSWQSSVDGGYPVWYYARNGDGPFCADCAKQESQNIAEFGAIAGLYSEHAINSLPNLASVEYEGASELCVECGNELQTAYGDPSEDGE